MTSSRQLAANRRNARSSTGPRTAAGKKRSAGNAARTGLSLPVLAIPGPALEAKSLAGKVAGDAASGAIRHLAAEIAEAQVDLARVRQVRNAILTAALERSLSPKFQSSRDATALCEAVHQLWAIHRYQRRAFSRRKFAIRMFDVARQNQTAEQLGRERAGMPA
jgi:hypothetical protein